MTTNEIFDLGDFSYEDAVSLLIDENINYLKKSLEGKSNLKLTKNSWLKLKRVMKHIIGSIFSTKRKKKHRDTFVYETVSILQKLLHGKKHKDWTDQWEEWSGLEKELEFTFH